MRLCCRQTELPVANMEVNHIRSSKLLQKQFALITSTRHFVTSLKRTTQSFLQQSGKMLIIHQVVFLQNHLLSIFRNNHPIAGNNICVQGNQNSTSD